MLTHEEALRLKNDAPHELARRAIEERNEFVFGVRDLRATFGREWGGEFRVIVNQNVVLHLVPRFTPDMENEAELPQFAVMPDDDHEGEDRTHRYEGWKDLEAFDGVIFYVTHEEYDALARELAAVAERYDDFPRLPDTLYPEAQLVRLIAGRVLEHAVVRAERDYDFTKRDF